MKTGGRTPSTGADRLDGQNPLVGGLTPALLEAGEITSAKQEKSE